LTNREEEMAIVFKKPKRTVNKVFIHCTANDDVSLVGKKLVDKCTEWHRARGWSTIGYHFIIDKLGNIMVGRDIERTPAAQQGHNTGTIAICVHGLDKKLFTKDAMNALIALCKQINDAYAGKISFHGHAEVSSKTCPVFDYKKVLKLDKTGKLGV